MAKLRKLRLFAATVLAGLAVGLAGPGLAATEAKTIQIKGEIIDTWCYMSGVMGAPEAVTGSAHHTCALWCAAGGIPVGVLAEDGTIYMVLKYKGENALARTDSIMEVQSHTITAKGKHYVRDGVNYIVVSDVVADDGIVKKNHRDIGVVPNFAIPKKRKKKK